MLQLDIATRIVGPAEDFYVVRPGSEFSLYEDFQRLNHVFLDFPGLILNPAEPFPSKDDARAMIARSIAIRDWFESGGAADVQFQPAQFYANAARGKRIGKYVSAAERLTRQLRPGTIIIVPGPGYLSDVLIGELVGSSTSVTLDRYGRHTLPARRVRWLKGKAKAYFSDELIDVLKNRNPIYILPRSLREEILRSSFDQYIIGDTYTARLRTQDEDFSTLNDFDIQSFLNFAAGAIAALEDGDVENGSLGLQQAIARLRQHRELIPELASNINSPGWLRIFGGSTLPIAVVVLLAAALSGEPVTADTLSVVNSMAPVGDPCTVAVEEQVKGAIQLMRIDDWQDACELARAAGEEADVDTSVRTSIIED